MIASRFVVAAAKLGGLWGIERKAEAGTEVQWSGSAEQEGSRWNLTLGLYPVANKQVGGGSGATLGCCRSRTEKGVEVMRLAIGFSPHGGGKAHVY